MGRRIQPTSKLGRFITKNYGSSANFAREINKHFKSDVFPIGKRHSIVITRWASGENKPAYARWKWDLMVKYCKKVHNVDVDLTWLEQQPETKSEPVTEQPQLDFEEFKDATSTERPYQTKEAATELIRRAYNIFELSKADVGFGSNCCRVIGGYWPSVTIFHDSVGKYGSKVIDLNTESDLLKVYRLLDKLAEGFKTETDEELINRVFDGIDPKDIERVAAIMQRKGGRDE